MKKTLILLTFILNVIALNAYEGIVKYNIKEIALLNEKSRTDLNLLKKKKENLKKEQPKKYEYERIIHFHSDLEVQKNCDLLVTETIKVYSKSSYIKRGIFRDIPLSYDYRGGNVKVGFELLEIKKNGKNEPYHTEWLDNGIRIYIGSEDVYLKPGEYTYEITYRVDHVLGFYEKYDEVYWNINGNGWQLVIDSISAKVTFPEGAELVQHDGYTGKYGSKEKEFKSRLEGNSVIYSGTKELLAEESLTVAVAFEKGHLEYPTFFEKMWYWIRSYILWVIAVVGLFLSFIYNFILWFKYGRDPSPGTIIPRFYPPEDFSPAECAYLKKAGKKTDEMFGAQLMGLAVKGYITLKYKGSTYYVTRNPEKEHKGELNDIEESFFLSLFGTKDTLIVGKKYNTRVDRSNKRLNTLINRKQKGKYYVRNEHLKWQQYIIPILFTALGFFALVWYGGSVWIIIGAIVLYLIKNFIFSYLFEQPTKEGRKKMDEIAGFEMYMKYADKLRIEANNPPTMDFDYFENNLAYAIALGVADEWKDQFDVKTIDEGFSHRMPYLAGISMVSLSSFSSDFSSTISAASTPPSSSSSSSGFSSGSGFSGGGFGGGGGGGW